METKQRTIIKTTHSVSITREDILEAFSIDSRPDLDWASISAEGRDAEFELLTISWIDVKSDGGET